MRENALEVRSEDGFPVDVFPPIHVHQPHSFASSPFGKQLLPVVVDFVLVTKTQKVGEQLDSSPFVFGGNGKTQDIPTSTISQFMDELLYPGRPRVGFDPFGQFQYSGKPVIHGLTILFDFGQPQRIRKAWDGSLPKPFISNPMRMFGRSRSVGICFAFDLHHRRRFMQTFGGLVLPELQLHSMIPSHIDVPQMSSGESEIEQTELRVVAEIEMLQSKRQLFMSNEVAIEQIVTEVEMLQQDQVSQSSGQLAKFIAGENEDAERGWELVELSQLLVADDEFFQMDQHG